VHEIYVYAKFGIKFVYYSALRDCETFIAIGLSIRDTGEFFFFN